MRQATPERRVPINSLAAGVQAIRPEVDAAIARVLDRGFFLLGPETDAFEHAFAAYHGMADSPAVGVGTGTDALWIGLKALGVEPGDEVLVTANAGVPPVAAVVAAGARPVYCDVDPETQVLDPAEIARRVTPRTKAVLVVHLYGRAAPMDAILPLARARGLKVLEDCAQAHGARRQGRLVGTWGDAAAFSFFPTKNLGAFGDAGTLLTADPAVAERARLLRLYGWREKYLSEEHSTVTRLDEIQAAILGVRLRHLDQANARRQAIAQRYAAAFAGIDGLRIPAPAETGGQHVYHLYVVRVRSARRDALRARLTASGVGTDVHYPHPVHLQAPYRTGESALPVTEAEAREVLSLPMYPELSDADADYVADQVRAFFG